ncbi:Phenylalanine ammonia-lyase [Musa troglodytarum]|uniref:Phenylalanine ammonia-lyase n=1 Tax=Musa troglodytarum TaxID=320322 RepID=A0A9E7G5Z2_9LILI|nr:Phenylalanine ammonia-lyase [Musa troglodytarum]
MGKGQRLEEELDGHLRSLSPMEDDTNFSIATVKWSSKMLGKCGLRERRKLFLSTRIDSSVKCFLERTLSSLCSEIPSVSGTSLEASKMKEKGVVDATILIWSGVGGTSFEASKMKEKGVVDATMRLKFECLISHQQPPHKLLP